MSINIAKIFISGFACPCNSHTVDHEYPKGAKQGKTNSKAKSMGGRIQRLAWIDFTMKTVTSIAMDLFAHAVRKWLPIKTVQKFNYKLNRKINEISNANCLLYLQLLVNRFSS